MSNIAAKGLLADSFDAGPSRRHPTAPPQLNAVAMGLGCLYHAIRPSAGVPAAPPAAVDPRWLSRPRPLGRRYRGGTVAFGTSSRPNRLGVLLQNSQRKIQLPTGPCRGAGSLLRTMPRPALPLRLLAGLLGSLVGQLVPAALRVLLRVPGRARHAGLGARRSGRSRRRRSGSGRRHPLARAGRGLGTGRVRAGSGAGPAEVERAEVTGSGRSRR